MILKNQNDEFKLYYDEENSKYKIEFEEASISLIESIIYCKIMPGLTVEPDYRTIHFKASSVKILTDLKINKSQTYLNLSDNNDILKLCYFLSLQLKHMIMKQKKCFITYDINKIIIIDKNKYLFLSNKNLFPLDTSEQNIQINNSFNITKFSSPELMSINNIPEIINYKTIYYSLGLVILHYLKQNLNNNEMTNEEVLNLMEGTKLYNFLKGAMETDIKNRRLLYL